MAAAAAFGAAEPPAGTFASMGIGGRLFVKRAIPWLAAGILLIVVIASLNLGTIVGPAYLLGNIAAPCCSSPTIANLPSGMRLYVREIQKSSQLSEWSIYSRFALNAGISVGLLVLAVFLAFRKAWAWKALFAIVGAGMLSFVALLAGAIFRNPHAFTWGWLVARSGLDELLLYGAVVFIFLRPSVRTLYVHRQQT